MFDFTAWHAIATQKGFHPSVIGFCNYIRHKMLKHDPKLWEKASDILHMDISDKRQQMLLKLVLEPTVMDELWTFHTISRNTIDADLVLDGEYVFVNREYTFAYSGIMSVCFALQHRYHSFTFGAISEKKFNQAFDNFFGFLNEVSPELAIMGSRTALSVLKIPCKLTIQDKHFGKFAKQYADLMFMK